MGTTYSIKIADRIGEDQLVILKEAIDQLLLGINQKMSTYIEGSELNVWNHSEKGISLSSETSFVIKQALEVAQATQGAFDPTVAPLVDLWGFGPRKRTGVPTPAQIESVLKNTGYQKIHFNAQNVLVKENKNLHLDLSAIAKGYGVDQVFELLKKRGLKNTMVEIGGEVRTSGWKSPGQAWRIGIEAPIKGERKVHRALSLTNMSMATSGNYRNFFISEGKEYAHTIDPKSGKPILRETLSATVIAPTCAEADAWATAFMVLGKRGLDLIQDQKIGVLLLQKNESGYEEILNDSMKVYLKRHP